MSKNLYFFTFPHLGKIRGKSPEITACLTRIVVANSLEEARAKVAEQGQTFATWFDAEQVRNWLKQMEEESQ